MLCERLNNLLSLVGLTKNKDIAEPVGCTISYISFIRNGKRIPLISGSTIKKIASVLYECSEQKPERASLESIVGAEKNAPKEKFISSVIGYLYEDMPARSRTDTRGRKPSKKNNNDVFAQRLSQVMELADLSNAKLARLIDIDSSAISRYRRGMRSASSNLYFAQRLCESLYDYLKNHQQIQELGSLMGAENAPNNEESFFEWLTGRNISEKENEPLSYENVPLLTLEEAADETEEGPYIGMEGLQKAVIRFLYEAARTGNGQMFLYSDMKMNWMVSSKTFFRRWYSLMTICANKGIKITIIHNIDRSKSEMTEAVKSWMPLYMTGNIQSFYNTKDNGTRFSNTIFIYKSDRKSGICIKGDSPRGLENLARYQYITNPEEIDFWKEYYAGLLKSSKPLMRPCAKSDSATSGGSSDNDEKLARLIQEKAKLNEAEKDFIKDQIGIVLKNANAPNNTCNSLEHFVIGK